MKYIASVDDQSFEIEILQNNQLMVDGEVVQADFQSVSDQPVYTLLLNGESFEALVYPSEQGVQVLLRGRLFDFTVEDERQRRLRQSTGGAAMQSGEYQLRAPMPGLIVVVPVKEGQEIKSGDDLIILESMKMQNELKAPRDGTVSRIRVKSGDNVDQNQVLLTLT
ncbi:MAG: biotin/lipoyl-binding protein [Anaerolineales bacterium]|nr:biotin/lipoyl-binding protein [Anaerolineales bacterium]